MSYNKYKTNKSLPFTGKTRLADVILADAHLIPVIGRFNIEYGFGNKTIEEVCDYYDINVWFFLEIINSFHNQQYFPKEQMQKFTSTLIVKYLSNGHIYYQSVKLPEIQGYIDEMEEQLTANNQLNVKLLSDFFKNYKNELEKHLAKEEGQIFPYAIALEHAVETGQINAELLATIKHTPIENFERNHENMEVTLSDLKNLIIRHLPPVVCAQLCQRLLTELFRFEEDLENHSRIEEKVLIPKVKQLEKQILERSGQKS